MSDIHDDGIAIVGMGKSIPSIRLAYINNP
jgi:hypothetical protein